MENIARRVVRRGGAAHDTAGSTTKVLARQLTWIEAARVLGIAPRHLWRIPRSYQRLGISAVMDQRGGRPLWIEHRRIALGLTLTHSTHSRSAAAFGWPVDRAGSGPNPTTRREPAFGQAD